MNTAWKVVQTQDIAAPQDHALATGPFGSSIASKFFTESGVPVIRGGNLSEDVDKRLIEKNMVFVSEEKAASFERSIVRNGDLIFTCWGTIGQVGLIDKRASYDQYVVSNKQMKLTPNQEIAESLFLYYCFSSPMISSAIKNRKIGSSVPGFNLGQLKKTNIPLPPLAQQRAISRILGTLDDKIELNCEMNCTLEATAQAIFRSWFVDFDPVGAKADGRKPFGMSGELADLFPDRFVESELGTVPDGWTSVRISDLIEVKRNSVKPHESPDEIFDHLSIPAYDAGQSPIREPGSEIKSNKYLVDPDSVLVSKLNPEIARVCLPSVVPQADTRVICSTEFLVCVPRPPFSRSYLYCLFSDREFRGTFTSLVTGTSKSHQRVKPKDFMKMKVAAPPEEVVAAFDDIASPLLAKVLGARNESETLADLRDILLPKLLSGEIRVDEAEKTVEEAA